MMELKLGKTETIATAIMILVLGFIAFWFFGYQPAMKEINNLRTEQEKIIKLVEGNKLTLMRLSELKQESAKMEASIVGILSSLPTKPEMASYLVLVNDLAERTGVKINTFKLSQPAAENNYTKIPIDLSVSGKFNDIPQLGGSLIEFFYFLEKIPRVTRVESLNIVRQGDNSNFLTVTLKISTFSLAGLNSQIQTATVQAPGGQSNAQTTQTPTSQQGQ
jgi:Tfp pilus assembly protein PilO